MDSPMPTNYDSEDEVFFGPITLKEVKKMMKNLVEIDSSKSGNAESGDSTTADEIPVNRRYSLPPLKLYGKDCSSNIQPENNQLSHHIIVHKNELEAPPPSPEFTDGVLEQLENEAVEETGCTINLECNNDVVNEKFETCEINAEEVKLLDVSDSGASLGAKYNATNNRVDCASEVPSFDVGNSGDNEQLINVAEEKALVMVNDSELNVESEVIDVEKNDHDNAPLSYEIRDVGLCESDDKDAVEGNESVVSICGSDESKSDVSFKLQESEFDTVLVIDETFVSEENVAEEVNDTGFNLCSYGENDRSFTVEENVTCNVSLNCVGSFIDERDLKGNIEGDESVESLCGSERKDNSFSFEEIELDKTCLMADQNNFGSGKDLSTSCNKPIEILIDGGEIEDLSKSDREESGTISVELLEIEDGCHSLHNRSVSSENDSVKIIEGDMTALSVGSSEEENGCVVLNLEFEDEMGKDVPCVEENICSVFDPEPKQGVEREDIIMDTIHVECTNDDGNLENKDAASYVKSVVISVNDFSEINEDKLKGSETYAFENHFSTNSDDLQILSDSFMCTESIDELIESKNELVEVFVADSVCTELEGIDREKDSHDHHMVSNDTNEDMDLPQQEDNPLKEESSLMDVKAGTVSGSSMASLLVTDSIFKVPLKTPNARGIQSKIPRPSPVVKSGPVMKTKSTFCNVKSPVKAYIQSSPCCLITNIKDKTVNKGWTTKLPLHTLRKDKNAINPPENDENVDSSNIYTSPLPEVNCKRAPTVEFMHTSKSKPYSDKKLGNTPRPIIYRHEGRVKIDSPFLSNMRSGLSSEMKDLMDDSAVVEDEVSILIGKEVSRTDVF